jgi:alpha-1,2-mannosyltransferase
MNRSFGRALLLVVLAPLAAASLAWGSAHALRGSADLMRRAEEIALFVRGANPYADPDMTYPPSALPVLAPLVAQDPRYLPGIWLVLNLGALCWLCGAIVREWGGGWDRGTRLAFLVVVAACKPVRLTLGMGQLSLIPLALTLAAVRLGRRHRPWSAGCLLGIALVKPTMVLPFLGLFAVRGWWRAILVALAFQAACWVGVSIWLEVGPIQLLHQWLERAREQQAAGLIDAPSVLARLAPGATRLARPVSLAVLLTGWIVLWVGRRRDDLTLVGVSCWFAAIFSYHRPYDLVLLVPPFALLLERWRTATAERRRAWRLLGSVLFAALLIAPSHPAVVNERAYDVVFIALCYAFFGAMLIELACRRGADRQPS